MYRNYFSQYLLKKNLASIIILLFTCFWIVGCSEEKQINEGNEAAVSTVDKNITAIHTVIEQEFTGLNDKYVRLQKDIDTKTEELMSNLPEGANGVSTGGTKEWKAYEEFVEKTYKPYFTDNAFDKLISTNFAFSFLYRFTWPEYVDYKMSVSNIIIKQEKEHPTIYRFTFEVALVNSTGATSIHHLKGEAICPEDGQIGRIQFGEGAQGLLAELK